MLWEAKNPGISQLQRREPDVLDLTVRDSKGVKSFQDNYLCDLAQIANGPWDKKHVSEFSYLCKTETQ